MIEKERLEELIKNKGMVWVYSTYSKPYRILPITFDGKREINSHTFCLNWNVKNIFETKEEAEWQLEFGNITRTETLNLPTWEEIKHDFIDNKRSAGNYCIVEFLGFQEYSLDVVVYNGEPMITISDTEFYCRELNKENYTLACRQAKELFLREKEIKDEENKD